MTEHRSLQHQTIAWCRRIAARRLLQYTALAFSIGGAAHAQCGVVAVLYGAGFGLGLLFRSDRTVAAFGRADLHFAAWTLAVGGALGLAAHLLELRAGPDDDYFRAMIENDPELSDDLKDVVFDEWDARR